MITNFGAYQECVVMLQSFVSIKLYEIYMNVYEFIYDPMYIWYFLSNILYNFSLFNAYL